MGAFSDNLKTVADRLLTKYGESITFTRAITADYNPSTGTVAALSSSSFTGLAHPRAYEENEIDGQVIQANDISVIVYSATEPLIGDSATIDDVVYRAMNVQKIQAQGDTIIYRLQLRV